MRFAKAQPPSGLGLRFVSAEKLDEEGCKFFSGAAQGFSREEGAKRGIFADAGVKGCGQGSGSLFTAERAQQCTGIAHGGDCTVLDRPGCGRRTVSVRTGRNCAGEGPEGLEGAPVYF